MLIGKSPDSYPYGVEYNPSSARPIYVWEGRGGQEHVGADLSLEDSLKNKFRQYFEKSNSTWFLAVINDMINGKLYSQDEIERIRDSLKQNRPCE